MVVKDVLSIVDDLTSEEKDFVVGYVDYLDRAARMARRTRDGETYLDDVVHAAKKAKEEPSGTPPSEGRVPGAGWWRPSKLRGRGEVSAEVAESRALERWRSRMGVLLTSAGAPSVTDADGQGDRVAIICGKTRAGTLRLRVRAWEEFTRWLHSSQGRRWPVGDSDVVNYLRWLVDLEAPKSRVTHFAATFHWILPRSGFETAVAMKESDYIKQAFGWAEVQLDDPSVAVRKAPRFLVGVIVSLEAYVMNVVHPKALRVTAWMRLIKIYGALRWDDFKRLRPIDVTLRESGLVGRLSRTKTTGVGRRSGSSPCSSRRRPPFRGTLGWRRATTSLARMAIGTGTSCSSAPGRV